MLQKHKASNPVFITMNGFAVLTVSSSRFEFGSCRSYRSCRSCRLVGLVGLVRLVGLFVCLFVCTRVGSRSREACPFA